jgi:hypothetical protein
MFSHPSLQCAVLEGGFTTGTLGGDRAQEFATAMRRVATTPQLSSFHFCASDICHVWENWGEASEVVDVLNCGGSREWESASFS